MADVALSSIGYANLNLSSTRYLVWGGACTNLMSELAGTYVPGHMGEKMPSAGSLSKLMIYCISNGGNSHVIALCKGSTQPVTVGNNTITIPASTTGLFRDTTNTDTVAAGDFWCVRAVTTGGVLATAEMISVSAIYTTTNGDLPLSLRRWTSAGTGGGIGRMSASGAHYTHSSSFDNRVTLSLQAAGTLSLPNDSLYNDGYTGTKTWRLRKNATDTSIVITHTGASPGWHDGTGSDSVAANDLIDWYTELSGGSGLSQLTRLSVNYRPDFAIPILRYGGSNGTGGAVVAPGATAYIRMGGTVDSEATDVTAPAGIDCRLTSIVMRNTTLGTGGSTVCTVRVNGVDQFSVTVPAGTPAYTRTSGSGDVTVGPTDQLSLKIVNGGSNNFIFTDYQLNGLAPIIEKRGSAAFGENTTVTASRAVAFGLDGATNVHNQAGQLKVFGNVEVTGETTLGDGALALSDFSDVEFSMPLAANDVLTYNGTNWVNQPGSTGGDVVGPPASVDGEIVLFNLTTGKLVKRATGTGIARVAAGVLGTGNVDLASEVTGTLPVANLGTTGTPQFARVGIGRAVDATAALRLAGQYGSDLYDAGNSGAAITLSLTNGNTQLLTLTASVTITISNPRDGFRYLFILKQDATGSRVPTFPANVVWSGAIVPTWSTAAAKVDLVTLVYCAALGAAGSYLAAANVDYVPV